MRDATWKDQNPNFMTMDVRFCLVQDPTSGKWQAFEQKSKKRYRLSSPKATLRAAQQVVLLSKKHERG